MGYLITDTPVRHPVIVIPMHNNLTLGGMTGQVTFGSNRAWVLLTQVAGGWVVRYQVSYWIRTVIDNDQLAAGIILAQKVAHSLGDKNTAVARWHNAGDERHICPYQVCGTGGGLCDLYRVLRWRGVHRLPAIG